jgi:hypothetical protein
MTIRSKNILCDKILYRNRPHLGYKEILLTSKEYENIDTALLGKHPGAALKISAFCD